MAAGFREGFVAAERFASATANPHIAGYASSWMRGSAPRTGDPGGRDARRDDYWRERVL